MVKKQEKSLRSAGRPPEPTSLHAARTRKEHALATLRELEVKEKQAQLLSADAVTRAWQDVLRQVRAAMLAVPSRVRSQLPHLSAHDAAVLDRELRNALAALGDDADAR